LHVSDPHRIFDNPNQFLGRIPHGAHQRKNTRSTNSLSGAIGVRFVSACVVSRCPPQPWTFSSGGDGIALTGQSIDRGRRGEPVTSTGSYGSGGAAIVRHSSTVLATNALPRAVQGGCEGGKDTRCNRSSPYIASFFPPARGAVRHFQAVGVRAPEMRIMGRPANRSMCGWTGRPHHRKRLHTCPDRGSAALAHYGRLDGRRAIFD
jgi:hypothetical protein